MPDDGDPLLAPNYLLKPGAKEKAPVEPRFKDFNETPTGKSRLSPPCTLHLVDTSQTVRTGLKMFVSWADPEGGGQGVRIPPRNCQIINFCHVVIFRQTPAGNLDPPPPPLKKFSGSELGFVLYLPSILELGRSYYIIHLFCFNGKSGNTDYH